MTRTDVVASSRPQASGATQMRKRSSSAFRRMLILPVALFVTALAMPSAALAVEEGSGYSQKPNTPTTPTTPAATTPTPTTGTSPSKESSTPAKETAPAKEAAPSTTSSTPTTKATKASTLPFTGLDLRWTIAVGLLLMGAGFSIVVLQRRQRRDSQR
jgi:hypothetical protein